MKMVKSLLLSSAAGVVAVAGAQAAELPVKAKPVEYVKICSLYGAGFFYIPGTDTCIKIGGALRVQAEYNTGAGGIPVGFGSAVEAYQGQFLRNTTNDVNFRTRIYLSVDVRQQTDFGTLRSYFRFGVNQTTPTDTSPSAGSGVSPFWDRAFIQFAGFTVGRTVSFYDGVTWADFNFNNTRATFDSSANGITLWAYTAQFGNGISLTVSAEDPDGRFKGVAEFAGTPLTPATALSAATLTTVSPGSQFFNANGLAGQPGGSNNGFLFPDIVGALRVDQVWGSAQVMAAMHDASGNYYTTSDVGLGHPDNAFGWAAGGAFSINLPTFGATGIANSQPNVDQVRGSFSYTQGAVGYATNESGASLLVNGGSSLAFSELFDGGYLETGGDVKLTTAWSAYGGYQHIWTPFWRTSVYGGYLSVTPDSSLQTSLCPATAGSNCLNWSVWQAGTRTQWNPVSQLDVGVDVLYSRLNTEFSGATTAFTVPGGKAGLTASDQDVWSVLFRVQRNFWP
jgi:hypothetical protein